MISLLLSALVMQSLAQTTTQFGMLPSINLNKKLPKDWTVNFKSEFRQSFYQETFEYEYVRTDLAFLVGKKVGVHAAVAGGYQVIVSSAETRNRYIQQFNLITRARSLTLGHRFSSDQTFGSLSETEVRLRYRLSSEIPLNGASLDPNEWYLKVSNEYVNDWQANHYDLEIRLLGFLGRQLAQRSKIEVGVDYRADRFLKTDLRNRFWFSLNLFQSL